MARRTLTPSLGPLHVARSRRHGRGVFAGRRFTPGDVLECCPILPVSARDRARLERTALRGYMYQRSRGAGAIALGLGSLYNHSAEPNAECELVPEEENLVVRALRTIAPDEEISIRYTDASDLWFEPRGEKSRSSGNGTPVHRSKARGRHRA
ncbi:MAG: SET domain-containing protein-lysine N-methyltransferase [Acidimicrobiia bacterium]